MTRRTPQFINEMFAADLKLMAEKLADIDSCDNPDMEAVKSVYQRLVELYGIVRQEIANKEEDDNQ